MRLIVDVDEPLDGRTGLNGIRVQPKPTPGVGVLPPNPPTLPLSQRLGPPVAPLPKHIREDVKLDPVSTLPLQHIVV